MSPHDANDEGEMALARITPEEIDRLLSGETEAFDPGLRSVALAVAVLRTTYSGPSAPEIRAVHLQAMSAAFGTAPTGPSIRAPRRRRWLILRVGIAAAAALLVTGTALAATGNLPDAAQDVVSKAVSKVGIHVPPGYEERGPDAEDETVVPSPSTRVQSGEGVSGGDDRGGRTTTTCVSGSSSDDDCGSGTESSQPGLEPGQQGSDTTSSDEDGTDTTVVPDGDGVDDPDPTDPPDDEPMSDGG